MEAAFEHTSLYIGAKFRFSSHIAKQLTSFVYMTAIKYYFL